MSYDLIVFRNIDQDFKIEHVGYQNDNDDIYLDNKFLHSLKNRSRSETNKYVLTVRILHQLVWMKLKNFSLHFQPNCAQNIKLK